MPNIVHNFASAGTVEVLGPAPSGTRYVVTGLACSSGTITVYHSPSGAACVPSGLITSISSTAALTNVMLYPSGSTGVLRGGFNESLCVAADSPCVATVEYVRQAPHALEGNFSYPYNTEKYATTQTVSGYYQRVGDGRAGDGQRKWQEVVQSGSYRTTY